MVAKDAPYVFLVHPKNTVGYLSTVFKPASVVDQGGIGVRNFWTFVQAEPAGAVKDIIANSTESLNSINPLYISGAPDSWVTELIWDRLMRIGPDGLAKPYAAKDVKWVDPTTLEVTLRPGMMWHDGKPVTPDDVIFSFEATMGDKAPMYKPFASNIASMEKIGADGVRTLDAMRDMLDMLLDISRLDAGIVEPRITRVDLGAAHRRQSTKQLVARKRAGLGHLGRAFENGISKSGHCVSP